MYTCATVMPLGAALNSRGSTSTVDGLFRAREDFTLLCIDVAMAGVPRVFGVRANALVSTTAVASVLFRLCSCPYCCAHEQLLRCPTRCSLASSVYAPSVEGARRSCAGCAPLPGSEDKSIVRSIMFPPCLLIATRRLQVHTVAARLHGSTV